MDGHARLHVEEETSPTHYADEFTLNDADIAYNAIGYVKKYLNGWIHNGATQVEPELISYEM
jgi:hypothetical protein